MKKASKKKASKKQVEIPTPKVETKKGPRLSDQDLDAILKPLQPLKSVEADQVISDDFEAISKEIAITCKMFERVMVRVDAHLTDLEQNDAFYLRRKKEIEKRFKDLTDSLIDFMIYNDPTTDSGIR